MKEFIIGNYILILSILLVLIITLIGYFADKVRIKKMEDNVLNKNISTSINNVAQSYEKYNYENQNKNFNFESEINGISQPASNINNNMNFSNVTFNSINDNSDNAN